MARKWPFSRVSSVRLISFDRKIFPGDQKDHLDDISCDTFDFRTTSVTPRPLVGVMPRPSIGDIEAKWSKNGSGKSWPKNG